ncbi:hypothetical protein ACFLZP_00920 [Patescibacteria group bacterium]
MENKLPKVLVGILALLFLGNLLVLDYWVFVREESPTSLTKEASSPENQTGERPKPSLAPSGSVFGNLAVGDLDVCPDACLETIDKAVATVAADLARKTTPSLATLPTTTPVFYQTSLSLGSGGTSSSMAWTDVGGSEFEFDLANYPSGVRVILQLSLKAAHLGGRCYARLYDRSHYRAVDYSFLDTDQNSFQFLTSNNLSIWQGNNSYRLQLKSLNGIECFLQSPRLVIKN